MLWEACMKGLTALMLETFSPGLRPQKACRLGGKADRESPKKLLQAGSGPSSSLLSLCILE